MNAIQYWLVAIGVICVAVNIAINGIGWFLSHFREFGLTDTTLFRLASRGALVITTDFRLNDLLIRYQYPSLNFNNIRFEDL